MTIFRHKFIMDNLLKCKAMQGILRLDGQLKYLWLKMVKLLQAIKEVFVESDEVLIGLHFKLLRAESLI